MAWQYFSARTTSLGSSLESNHVAASSGMRSRASGGNFSALTSSLTRPTKYCPMFSLSIEPILTRCSLSVDYIYTINCYICQYMCLFAKYLEEVENGGVNKAKGRRQIEN